MFLSLSCLFMIACCSYGQQHPLLATFAALQIENEVRIDFGIVGGSSCQGVQLERSVDGLVYESIDFIPGVCGGSEFTEYYAVNDRAPISNSVVYYRLELGQQGKTDPIEFRFVPLDNGISVYPNPSSSRQEIRISNPFSLGYTLVVFCPLGEEIFRSEPNHTDFFVLESGDLPTGIFFLKLYNNSDGREFYSSRIMRVD
jgi:hypothetical protein